MNVLGRRRLSHRGLILAALAGALLVRLLPAATPPGTPAQTQAAPATTSGPAAKKPSVDDILSTRKPAPFDFTNAKITDIMDYVAKCYDVKINNKYELNDMLTIKQAQPLSARDAINILDGAIMATGYTLVETVQGDPPRVILTVVPTKVDAGTLVTIHYGNDPTGIPEGDARRTQVLTYNAVDPDVARNMILAVVGKQAEVEVNTSTKTIVMTDTGTHVHTAAALLQELERQAAGNK